MQQCKWRQWRGQFHNQFKWPHLVAKFWSMQVRPTNYSYVNWKTLQEAQRTQASKSAAQVIFLNEFYLLFDLKMQQAGETM